MFNKRYFCSVGLESVSWTAALLYRELIRAYQDLVLFTICSYGTGVTVKIKARCMTAYLQLMIVVHFKTGLFYEMICVLYNTNNSFTRTFV